MYRLGWDERNGGNISYMLSEKEAGEYLDLNNVIRTIPTGFDATDLIGKIFIVTGTGRLDYPNQINNVLVFPGIFRGALDVRASDINDEMKMAASHAIANLVSEDELNAEYIIPAAFDERVGKAVAEAVGEAAKKCGIARL